jgi:hypothetical protein
LKDLGGIYSRSLLTTFKLQRSSEGELSRAKSIMKLKVEVMAIKRFESKTTRATQLWKFTERNKRFSGSGSSGVQIRQTSELGPSRLLSSGIKIILNRSERKALFGRAELVAFPYSGIDGLANDNSAKAEPQGSRGDRCANGTIWREASPN